MSEYKFDFKSFLNESRETLLNPKSYFPSMSLSGGMVEPLIKAVIYGLIAGLFTFIWTLLGLTAAGSTAFLGVGGIMALIGSVVAAIIGVLIGGAVMLLISSICDGNRDFEANLRVSAAVMVIYPVSTFFSFLYRINPTLGLLVSMAITFYSIYLVYEAVISALKGKESTAKIVMLVLVVLALLGTWGSRRASQSLLRYSDRMEVVENDKCEIQERET